MTNRTNLLLFYMMKLKKKETASNAHPSKCSTYSATYFLMLETDGSRVLENVALTVLYSSHS